jgi:hypothetical protein
MRKISAIEEGPVIAFSDREYATIPPEWSGPELAPEIETVEIKYRCGHTLVHQFYRSADHSERDAMIEALRGRDCYVCEQGHGDYADTVKTLWRMIADLTTENKRSREKIEKLRTVLDMRVLEVEDHQFNKVAMQHELSYQGKLLAILHVGVEESAWKALCRELSEKQFRVRPELTKKVFKVEQKYSEGLQDA